MTQRIFFAAAFAAGLAAIGWIGAGYLGSNALALGLVVLIGGFYLGGAAELWRYRAQTGGLQQVLSGTDTAPPTLEAWLSQLPPGLRHAVRQRAEGERAVFAGPVMTQYAVGLLVLLGMLGTFLGMVVTLRGTGLALASAADVETIRASLAAPVQGLGQAFGCSVAGVAASAALGLMAALARRERQGSLQQLDRLLATTLRGFTRSSRRHEQREAALRQQEETLRLLRVQAEALPALMDRLQRLAAQMEDQGRTLQQGLLDGQAQFHGEARQAYAGLAASVGDSLRVSLAESARQAGAAFGPAVHETMASVARETATLRDALGLAVQQQLDGIGSRLAATTDTLNGRWQAALDAQQRQAEHATQGLEAGLDRFTQGFEQRSQALVDTVAGQLQGHAAQWSGQWTAAWGQVLAGQQAAHDGLETRQRALQDEALTQQRDAQQALVAAQREAAESLLGQQREQHAALLHEHRSAHAELRQRQHDGQDGLLRQQRESLEAVVLSQRESHAAIAAGQRELQDNLLAAQREHQQALVGQTRDGLASALAGIERQGDHLLRQLAEAQANHDAAVTARERERMEAFHQGLAAMAETWQREGRQVAELIQARQQQIGETLERTAGAITAQAEQHTRATVDEIGRLLQSAGEAPRAAAEVMGELRQALSDSLARDTTQLQERTQLMGTLSTLLDAVNHASRVLAGAGARFSETVDTEARSLQGVSAQLVGSAAEVASLGEGFGVSVQLFSQASERLTAQLGRIEAALGQSLSRSDEQLAYYVAQAREIVDLTLDSQRQIVEDMQRLQAAAPVTPAAASKATPATARAQVRTAVDAEESAA